MYAIRSYYAVQINERYYENVEPGDVEAILDRLRGASTARASDEVGEG